MKYWDTFNINGLSFISLSDIIKSSVYPIFTILFTVAYNLTIQNLILPSNADNETIIKPRRSVSNMTLLIAYFVAICAVATIIYLTKYKSPDKLMWFGLLNALFPSIYLINNNFLKGQFISERARRLAIDLIVFIPVVAYYTGKYKSELIYQNLQYKYSVNTHIDNNILRNSSSDTLKFVGNTEKHFVFTDLNNIRIYFIKSDNIDTLILYEKK
ncbi:MAG: hypothetical protein ABIP35_17610 [Ginsengibacter sp.]